MSRLPAFVNKASVNITLTKLTLLYLNCQDGPFKTKLLPNRAHGIIQQPNWPLRRLSRRQKKLSKWAPGHPSAGAGPTEAVKTGLSKKTNGALSNIELPRRVLTTKSGPSPTEAHYQDGALQKINCCRNGSTTSNYRSEPLPKQSRRAPSDKKLLLSGTRQDPTTGAGLY